MNWLQRARRIPQSRGERRDEMEAMSDQASRLSDLTGPLSKNRKHRKKQLDRALDNGNRGGYAREGREAMTAAREIGH